MRRLLCVLAFVIGLAAAASAAPTAVTVKIGGSPPAIKVGKWVKGPAVTKIDSRKTYVIEFWATWCGPCRYSIPRLTKLAKQYKNKVTFVGVSIHEKGDVAAFVKKMGDQMGYSVATDTSDNYMAEKWYKAAGENGIPSAFVVSKGKLVWIGHPDGGLADVLPKILAGKFDVAACAKHREKYLAEEAARTKAVAEFKKLIHDGKLDKAFATIDAYIAGGPATDWTPDAARTRSVMLPEWLKGDPDALARFNEHMAALKNK